MADHGGSKPHGHAIYRDMDYGVRERRRTGVRLMNSSHEIKILKLADSLVSGNPKIRLSCQFIKNQIFRDRIHQLSDLFDTLYLCLSGFHGIQPKKRVLTVRILIFDKIMQNRARYTLRQSDK